jgi:hypothetical protein
MVKRGSAAGSVVALFIALLFTLVASASDAQMYFSSDKNGQHRVTNIQEGEEIFIVVVDNDENIDCDIRDKMSPEIKVMDPKTGAYIVWDWCPEPGCDLTDFDYLEETGADTGVFVSNRALQVGTRESFSAGEPWKHTHVVDVPVDGRVDDFQWGHYLYDDRPDYADERGWFGDGGSGADPDFNTRPMWGRLDPTAPSDWQTRREYLIGRFENMDTVIGMYQDPNDATDVAVTMAKIIDTEATISWDQEVYKDANASATIVVVDPDENLNCNEVEAVPVFILVNPGSWNPDGSEPSNFCKLRFNGGVNGSNGNVGGNVPIRWYNIYNSDKNFHGEAGAEDGRYYLDYPVEGEGNVTWFDTAAPDGITPVSFYAWETGTDTGVFQLNINQILEDLEFDELFVRDVLVAYYLDPNDFDDFKLATATIEERRHSITSFTNANRGDKDLFWIGRDPVYVQVIDANANVDPCCPEQVVVHICDPHGEDDVEWAILDETSSNSPVFFTFAGYQLRAVWDPLGIGLVDSYGGFQLQQDNWKLEAFNEDDVYARYNDVYYETGQDGLGGIGDSNAAGPTAMPPEIDRVRVANDVSFDLMSIADTQVYDGTTTNMFFLDRQGNRVSGYVNGDCVFVKVIDPDQDEDQHRRERIDGYWDGGQNFPFGPMALNEFDCDYERYDYHRLNDLLGDTNIFNDEPEDSMGRNGWAKLYVLNPRSGRWAAVDLLETGVATGDFVSVICIDLADVHACVPSLGVLPGDTVVAFYQDPSNHSDNAMISIKVGIGGGETPPTQQSTTMFVDAEGDEVASYAQGEAIYVLVTDLSHTQDVALPGAVVIDGAAYDLITYGSQSHMFFTGPIQLDLAPGDAITATYTDPTDPTDTSSDTITIIASVLEVIEFYAGPSPFDGECTFGYIGTGTASVMSVEVYNLAGSMVWAEELTDATEIVWDGMDESGSALANGAYIYRIYATDGTDSFTDTGKLFMSR